VIPAGNENAEISDESFEEADEAIGEDEIVMNSSGDSIPHCIYLFI
jgi:hypothetical protein